VSSLNARVPSLRRAGGGSIALLAAVLVALVLSAAGADPASARKVLPPKVWTGTINGTSVNSNIGTTVSWTANVRFELHDVARKEKVFIYGGTGSATYTISGGDQFCTWSGSQTFPIPIEQASMAVSRTPRGWRHDIAVGHPTSVFTVHYDCGEGDAGDDEWFVDPILRTFPITRSWPVGNGLSSISGTYRDGSYTVHWSFSGTPRRGDLQANPGGPYTVRRGGRKQLDGSGSRPRREIVEYRWRFQPIQSECPEGASGSSGRKQGRRVSIVALCDVRATLTVEDRDGDTDSKSAVVKVRPRGPSGWRTPFAHREKTGDPRTPKDPPSATSVGGGNYAFSLFGGLNVSDCGAPTASSEILCPPLRGERSWLGSGYELARVNDPNGPFHGDYYVASTELRVKRAGLINPTILPGSTFYQHNLAAGRDVAGFLNAIRQHEGLGTGAPRTGHSLAMRDVLRTPTGDARRVIEGLFAPSREGARNTIDRALHAIDRRLDRESDDPLPDIWTGSIDFYDAYQQQWITGAGFTIPGPMRG
jgi:hypothetical protein